MGLCPFDVASRLLLGHENGAYSFVLSLERWFSGSLEEPGLKELLQRLYRAPLMRL